MKNLVSNRKKTTAKTKIIEDPHKSLLELCAKEPYAYYTAFKGGNIRMNPLNHFSLRSLFCRIFLPTGYPQSVSPDYLNYQIFDTLQAFCSSMCGIISTKAVLKGYGVGDESSSVIAAALSWILTDGISSLSRCGYFTD